MSHAAQSDKVKLNLGGGREKLHGYLNLDILDFEEVDIVCDVVKGIPLADNSVEEIVANHFLEHIPDTFKVMSELYRVSAPGAILRIKCPYFKSIGAFKDPSHVSFFTERTFEYFDPDFVRKGLLPDYATRAVFKTEKISYIWSKRWMRYLPFKKFLVDHFWNVARTIYYELRVVK